MQRFPWKANKLDLPERTPQIPDKWPLVLSLKVGARVRCLRNILRDGELETANNQLGTVVDIDARWNEVTVRWDAVGCIEANETVVRRCWWLKKQRFTGPGRCDVHVVVKQVPLSLACVLHSRGGQGGTRRRSSSAR